MPQGNRFTGMLTELSRHVEVEGRDATGGCQVAQEPTRGETDDTQVELFTEMRSAIGNAASDGDRDGDFVRRPGTRRRKRKRKPSSSRALVDTVSRLRVQVDAEVVVAELQFDRPTRQKLLQRNVHAYGDEHNEIFGLGRCQTHCGTTGHASHLEMSRASHPLQKRTANPERRR